jgi:Xaa-Pro aminopeptidase
MRNFYSLRRSRLRRSLAADGVEACLVTFLPNVRYLTGFTGSAGALLVEERGAAFITDFRYRLQAGKEVTGCRLVVQRGGLAETLADLVRKKGLHQVGFENRHLTCAFRQELAGRLGKVLLQPLEEKVETLRLVKDRSEISLMRKSIRIAGRAYRRAARTLRGRTERQVALAMERVMKEEGASDAAFPPIVAGGPRGALPHAAPGERRIRDGNLVVVDFGAVWKGYCSDVTRTRLPGRSRGKAKEIYRLVSAAQEAAIAAVRPGVEACTVDQAARRVIEDAGYGSLFGHGTGHGVGLEVHEGPAIASGSRQILKPGMVFTVEPGVYVEKFGGVRIEDMVLVTETGCEIMTRSIPRARI